LPRAGGVAEEAGSGCGDCGGCGALARSKDAARMSSATGQQQYAQWLAAGIEEFFAG
jgi:hypothetical protein